jgi:hypothetical protein
MSAPRWKPLADQIALTEPVDEDGHSFLMNDAYLDSLELLKTLASDAG